MIYLGLPQWSHPKWVRLGITSLEEYARHFNCVEGNTTLYALPRPEIVERWRDQTTDDFRFCFKFPATISHNAALRNCGDLTAEFFARMSPLANRIGQYWLQLPATFSPQDLPALWQFLNALPQTFTYGVEVRHPAFFNKGETEKALNRGLHERGVNRVILDSRPVHSAVPHSEAIIDAQRKKPRVPVHAVVTANHPMVRFIGSDNMQQNQQMFAVWLQKLAIWQQTTTPYLFLHTPDIAQAPELVDALWQALQDAVPGLGPAPANPQQSSLFYPHPQSKKCHLTDKREFVCSARCTQFWVRYC
jgi:uncharacterized protein YecE (DUF72 family)